MLTQQPILQSSEKGKLSIRIIYPSDKVAMAFICLAMSYLLLGMLFGLIGGIQYLLPEFLKEKLSFEKTRPLHVYLVISWIFTAAQGAIYYFLPRITNKNLWWPQGAWWHFALQLLASLSIMASFFMGRFGGREYLEFPPLFGSIIALSWLPFAINFFASLKPDYIRAPVYFFSWTAGIVFFYITLGESYLWVFKHFGGNEIRDITIQWKALGSMVGSWNMLVFGCSMYVMHQLTGNERPAHSKMAFFFFFLGFGNLLFNWGHHTYMVPAASWVRTVAFVVSMTELLIFGNLILIWKKTVSNAQRNFNFLPWRLFSFADFWIFVNLALALFISVPAFNTYTHGTHITVAHAMGATIGINTMLLMGIVLYILQGHKPQVFSEHRKTFSAGIYITNFSLIVFWISLIASGIVKIIGKINHESFAVTMEKSRPLFKLFALSGAMILIGLAIMLITAMKIIYKEKNRKLLKIIPPETR